VLPPLQFHGFDQQNPFDRAAPQITAMLNYRLHLGNKRNSPAFTEFTRTGTLCQMRALATHMDEYTVLFALIIKQAGFEQINRHIYLLLKKERHANLGT
jgi:hypothetical protein